MSDSKEQPTSYRITWFDPALRRVGGGVIYELPQETVADSQSFVDELSLACDSLVEVVQPDKSEKIILETDHTVVE